ncbi:MAG: LLM class flavin-dependent oxidoreductase [Xanthobacteraceae bacterium]|nr:LLM class flavin-dependent oxidoreductase [Xanthobacteraceae bacterium]
MKFAHFSHVWGKPDMTAHARYEQLWRELELCDELGFDYSFCVEHHFRPDESWMSSPALYAVGGNARTRRLRVGVMGFVVPLHHPLRLAEEIAIVDQMSGGRFECGLVPGISPGYFTPFGIDYNFRKSPTFEFVNYLRAAYGEAQPFSFKGDNFTTDSALLAVQPVQRPHPPLWMMSRDPQTLAFCAENGINTGYFISVSRAEAGPRYRKFLEDWNRHGHKTKPNIGYSTVVYVDETDENALERGLQRASQAYVGLLPLAERGETFQDRLMRQRKRFEERGEHSAAKIMSSMFDPNFMLQNELVFIGSPKTVADKIRKASEIGFFNTLMCEFNFADLPEADLMRSIRLFGEEVIPALRGYEPF